MRFIESRNDFANDFFCFFSSTIYIVGSNCRISKYSNSPLLPRLLDYRSSTQTQLKLPFYKQEDDAKLS